MRDDDQKASGGTTAPRIVLDAARVLGGLADDASKIAAGSKPVGKKPTAK